MKRTVLFLCTGNSARSQMAEALVNILRGEQWRAFSAGTHPTGSVHPNAMEVMREIGIDISIARSKSFEEFRETAFDLVITLCDDAAEECPVWFGQGMRVHIGFPDPAVLPLQNPLTIRRQYAREGCREIPCQGASGVSPENSSRLPLPQGERQSPNEVSGGSG